MIVLAVEREKQQPAKEDELSVRRADSGLIEMYVEAQYDISMNEAKTVRQSQ
jgi:hypothetical protein